MGTISGSGDVVSYSYALSRRAVLTGSIASASLGFLPSCCSRRKRRPIVLSRLCGFNLTDKAVFNNRDFREEDFDIIAEWGFSFVRLPLDYRNWTLSTDHYCEWGLRQIDRAITWAMARRIHVNLCLYRAPGYCVGGAIDQLNLWADGTEGVEARRQFEGQWSMLSSRYRDMPVASLSFNLVNEPPMMDPVRYVRTMAPVIAAIHALTPERLVIVDGITDVLASMLPVPSLKSLHVAESLHAYSPRRVTHFREGWSSALDTSPAPTWPTMNIINGYLFGTDKPKLHSPLIVHGHFARATKLEIQVELVSSYVRLLITADNLPILDQQLHAGPDNIDAAKGVRHEGTGSGWYQALFDRLLSAIIPAGTKVLAISAIEGDWMTFSRLRLTSLPSQDFALEIEPGLMEYGIKQRSFTLHDDGVLQPDDSEANQFDRLALWRNEITPWRDFAAQGGAVHVGEFGVDNFTAHEVALSWMNDNLKNFKAAGFGWALWNLRGRWGVLDSQRTDVAYESFRESKLDRRMLELLRHFGTGLD